MKMRKSLLSFSAAGLWLVLGSFFPSSSASQEVVIRFQKPLQHEVFVTLKLIQVYITDKKGKSVQDLQKSDFVVYDNGQKKEITEFEKHILAGGPAKVELPPPAEKIVPTAVPPPPQVMRRKFFLFFDFAFNTQKGVKKSREAALHMIDTELGPDDEVGLLSYSVLKGLSIHEYLTTEHQKIRQAIASMDVKNLSGRAEDVEEEYWREAVEGGTQTGGSVVAEGGIPSSSSWRQESKDQALNFILKMTALAKALRYIPGQKHFILFSTGIASSLLYGRQVGNAESRSRFETGDYLLRTQNEEMLKEMSAANCTIFTFDTRESAMVPSLFAYDDQTFGGGGRQIFTVSGVQQSAASVFRDDSITGQYALRRLSNTTGGKYFSNIEKYEENLGQVQDLTGSFYVLGYYINEQWDGQYHKIKVEVNRKGCEVRAQAGYFSPKPYREFSDLEKQLHLYDLALSDRPLFQTPLVAAMTPLISPGTPGSHLLLLSKIPSASVEKLTGNKVEIMSFIFDEQDNLTVLRRAEENLSKYGDKDIYYASGASLQPGNYKCRLVIRDLVTGAAAVASTKAYVPPRSEQGIRLYTPLLLVPAKNSAYLEGRLSDKKGAEEGVSSWGRYYPFDPGQFSPLAGELRPETTKLTAIVPCAAPGAPLSTLDYTARLINAAGEDIPVLVSFLDRTTKDNVQIQMMELHFGTLKPGHYALYIFALEPGTKDVSHVQVPLVIRP